MPDLTAAIPVPAATLMLPTFVIGLREGVEAALIVGIVAAFLRQEGRRDALRWMWAGVALATAICVAGGVTLELVSRRPAAAPAGGCWRPWSARSPSRRSRS